MKKLRAVKEAKKQRRHAEELERLRTIFDTAMGMVRVIDAEKEEITRDLSDRINQLDGALDTRIEEIVLLATFIFQLDPDRIPQDVRDVLMVYHEQVKV